VIGKPTPQALMFAPYLVLDEQEYLIVASTYALKGETYCIP